MNEAALIAGRNPELDEVQRIGKLRAEGEEPAKLPRDEALQRALDFIAGRARRRGSGRMLGGRLFA